jgi:hypothetical protein
LEKEREVSGAGSEERASEYTIVGVVSDSAELNRSVRELRDLGVSKDDLTVILKREDPDEPEPFPEGTRYIVIPDDKRGLEVPLGFALAFVLLGIFFVIVVPSIGLPTFLVFISLAAILLAGSFSRVGAQPILTDMEAPRAEAGQWNDEFEMGKVLIFAVTRERRLIRPMREILQANDADYYILEGRLEPRAVAQAVLHRAGPNEHGGSVMDAQDT